jgi:peptidoglycan/LPS O-acetylase OafA/YrhL
MRTANLPDRFYSLDVLRGLAALGIVFWHWDHFFYQGTELGAFDRERQPFYLLFKPLYLHGAWAVPLFFCLSGFIFFWLYSDKIARRAVPPQEFAVLRFSRLYPLHLLTLFVVLAGQLLMRWRSGSFFVYPYNNLYHFMLQLGFASQWGFQKGMSFNGPIWSVSVEILLYALFFIVCTISWRRWWHLVIFSCLGYFLIRVGPDGVGRGISLFFIGGLSFHAFVNLWRRGVSRSKLLAIWAFAIMMWLLIPLIAHHNSLYHLYRVTCGESFTLAGRDPIGYALVVACRFSLELLFPLTIITLTLTEAYRGTLGRRLAFLGDISYSSYLLHYPLQLLFVLATGAFGISNSFFYSPVALCLFFLILIPLALCTYQFFERPSQSWLRAHLLPSARTAPRHFPPQDNSSPRDATL